jgi:hypothetical protein
LLEAKHLERSYFDFALPETVAPELRAQFETHNSAPGMEYERALIEHIKAEKAEMARYKTHPQEFATAKESTKESGATDREEQGQTHTRAALRGRPVTTRIGENLRTALGGDENSTGFGFV